MKAHLLNRKGKGVADFIFLIIISTIVLGIIFFGGLIFGYIPLLKQVVNIQDTLQFYVTADDKGTEVVSLLDARTGDVRYMELLGSYQADGIEDNPDYIQPVKDTLDTAFKSYDFSVTGTDISFKNNVPSNLQDTTQLSIQGCGSQKSSAGAIFLWPVRESSGISSGFGGRELNKGVCSCHPGIDISVNGVQVMAAADGDIVRTYSTCVEGNKGCNSGYGNFVVIKHTIGGSVYFTYYDHLKSVTRTSGHVAAGDPIAISGNTGYSTGPHLHFEVRSSGDKRITDSIDPCTLFKNMPSTASGSCDHAPVAACSYVKGASVQSYQTDIPLPGPVAGANLKGHVIFKQWD